ncbi:MAG: FixH family protein [Tumebacillaceae bacterium]
MLSGKRKGLAVAMAALLLSVAVTGCSNSDLAAKPVSAKPIPLTLDFYTMPLDIKVNKVSELRLSVKRGNKVIQDAHVEFEVWREGDPIEKHVKTEMIVYNYGYYFTEWTFTRPGDYHITLHTTVDDYHQMPTVDFKVTE